MNFHRRERLLFSNRAVRVLDHNTGGRCAHSHDRKTEIRFPVECTDRKIILFRATKSLTAEKLFFRTIPRANRFHPFLPRPTNQVRNRESSSFWNPTRRILNSYSTWLRKFRKNTIYYDLVATRYSGYSKSNRSFNGPIKGSVKQVIEIYR